MLSSPTPADRRPTRAIASTALRSVGLIDRDTQMRDATKGKDRPGGKKTLKKIGHRNRILDLYKDSAGPSRSHLVNKHSSTRYFSVFWAPSLHLTFWHSCFSINKACIENCCCRSSFYTGRIQSTAFAKDQLVSIGRWPLRLESSDIH